MSVNWAMSPLQYAEETANTPLQYKMGLVDRFKTSMQDAMLYNPMHLIKQQQELTEMSKPVSSMSYTPAELRDMYSDSIGNTVPWAKYLNREGKVNQQVVDRLMQRYVATSASAQLMRDGYSSFSQGAASLLGGVAGGLRDPINIALGLIPIYGLEAAVGRAVVGTSPSVLRAFGSRFLSGAAEDMLISGTFAVPYEMSVRSDLGDNPTMQEYFQTVAMGGLIGGGLRGLGGLITDPRGRKLAVPTTVRRTETENRLGNMPPKELDAVGTYVVQADVRGVDADVDTLLDMSESFKKSTISAEHRLLAEQSLAFKAGIEEELDVTISRDGDKTVATATVNGIKYSAKAASEAGAREILNNRINNSINNRILPKITDNGDGTFSAQYTRDMGPAKELVGHGRSEVEAVRNLHTLYNDAFSTSKKTRASMDRERKHAGTAKTRLATLKQDIQNGTVSTYGTGGGSYREMARQAAKYRKEHAAEKAALEAQYKEDYANATTSAEKSRLTRAFNKQNKELDARLESELTALNNEVDTLMQDASIREANANNVDLEAFDTESLMTEEAFNHKLNQLMTNRNERLQERLKQRELEVAEATSDSKSIKDMENYATRIEDRILASKAFNDAPPELQQKIANYEGLKADTELLNSKKMDEIFNAFEACERGL